MFLKSVFFLMVNGLFNFLFILFYCNKVRFIDRCSFQQVIDFVQVVVLKS